MSPYIILGVPLDADDKLIRKAYLEAIKSATPEANPKRFQAVTEAYKKIKDEHSRLTYYLFNEDCFGDSPLDVFVQCAQTQSQFKPMAFDAMKRYLSSCSKK